MEVTVRIYVAMHIITYMVIYKDRCYMVSKMIYARICIKCIIVMAYVCNCTSPTHQPTHSLTLTHTYSLTHTHSITHSLTHSLNHQLTLITHSLTHSLIGAKYKSQNLTPTCSLT